MRVLVATDLSSGADEAIVQGGAWSSGAGALAVVHVVPNLQDIAPLFPQRAPQGLLDAAVLASEAAAATRCRVSTLTGRAPAEIEVFVDHGIDYAEVVRRATAWRADLVVVGSQGRTGLSRLLVGSVAERVARYAPCPVLIARASPASGPVVAATDLSDPSIPAIKAADKEARHRHAPLVVVHAIDVGPFPWWTAGIPFGMVPSTAAPGVLADVQAAAMTVVREAMASAGADGEAQVLIGDATASIVRHADAEGAQLVVVGTHGRTGLAHVMLGGVAEKVVRTASCSVLVVRLAREGDVTA